MRTAFFSVFSRIIVSLVLAVLASGLISFDNSAVIAAEKHASSEFKDPYNGGGIKLPNGGGEPGSAYTAFIRALYSKDHMRICKLLAEPADVPKCLEQKEALNGTIGMFTQPISHKVRGGFMKGDEATLNVAYKHKGVPENTGFVVMKKTKNRWFFSSTGGSGSANISAEASGTTDLASGSTAASAGAGQSPEAKYTGPALGKWTFEGKDDKKVLWSGTLMVREDHECVLDIATEEGAGRGVGAPCKWNPAKREISFGGPQGFTGILSTDGKRITQGKWIEGDEDYYTKKVTILGTGTWSAVLTGNVSAAASGQADTGSASAAESTGAATTGGDPEFAVIQISPNIEEYTGKCPVSITYTADITFKTPLPDKFSYRWERSDGKKTKDRVVKPSRNGQMSIREVWRGGKSGERHDISMRFFAESGGAQMVLDPPSAKVICK